MLPFKDGEIDAKLLGGRSPWSSIWMILVKQETRFHIYESANASSRLHDTVKNLFSHFTRLKDSFQDFI